MVATCGVDKDYIVKLHETLVASTLDMSNCIH